MRLCLVRATGVSDSVTCPRAEGRLEMRLAESAERSHSLRMESAKKGPWPFVHLGGAMTIAQISSTLARHAIAPIALGGPSRFPHGRITTVVSTRRRTVQTAVAMEHWQPRARHARSVDVDPAPSCGRAHHRCAVRARTPQAG